MGYGDYQPPDVLTRALLITLLMVVVAFIPTEIYDLVTMVRHKYISSASIFDFL